jgi:hypothetical protein
MVIRRVDRRDNRFAASRDQPKSSRGKNENG